MADDKKNIPDVASPTEAPAPTAEAAAMPEQLAPEPELNGGNTNDDHQSEGLLRLVHP